LDSAPLQLQQRLAHGLGDKPAHFRLPMKFHLAFGGMNIHVHLRGMNFQK
jgi:hypothetical protein